VGNSTAYSLEHPQLIGIGDNRIIHSVSSGFNRSHFPLVQSYSTGWALPPRYFAKGFESSQIDFHKPRDPLSKPDNPLHFLSKFLWKKPFGEYRGAFIRDREVRSREIPPNGGYFF
jgi:hypothetical protein